MRNTEPADNVPLDEVYAFGLSDCGQRFDLYPLSEVIDSNDSELGLSPGSWEWSYQVYTPLCERPKADDRRQWLWRLFQDVGESLAFITFMNKLC